MRPGLSLSLVAALVLHATLAHAAPLLPVFSAADFVAGAPIDNPYFPLLDFKTRVFEGSGVEDGEVFTERFELTKVGDGPVILGVQTTAQRDRAFEDGVLVEDTFDYYAQDSDGNVWYFGEDVTNYHYDEDGHLIGTDTASSWRAGVNGALPGLIMPVDLALGLNYYQEYAPLDDALDEGTTSALGLTMDGYTNVLRVLETTVVEPDARGFKYYAPGLGLIREDEGLDADLENPTLVLWLLDVPEPSTLLLAGIALSAGFVARRRRRSCHRSTT
jgi:hypothetical protein